MKALCSLHGKWTDVIFSRVQYLNLSTMEVSNLIMIEPVNDFSLSLSHKLLVQIKGTFVVYHGSHS